MINESQSRVQAELTIEQLKGFLHQANDHFFPPNEDTFFSIGGRGHWENPTSDILAYFMQPKGQHGFGTKFLQAFFKCMEKDYSKLELEKCDVIVRREQPFREGRIDFAITGPNWILVIENKIRHSEVNNPYPLYEEYAELDAKREPYFAILSPDGVRVPREVAVNHPWKPVSYKDYLGALRHEFVKDIFDHPISKWQVFAREFIVHLENELYETAMSMKNDQVDFVEKNLHKIMETNKLLVGYQKFLLEELQKRLQKEKPSRDIQFIDKVWAFKGWAVVTEDVNLEFFFSAPFHSHQFLPATRFWIGFEINGLHDLGNLIEKLEKEGVDFKKECSMFYYAEGFTNSTDAMDKLSNLAEKVFKILQS